MTQSSAGPTIYGLNTGSGNGVLGESSSGYGVYGRGQHAGVYGESSSAGVVGTNTENGNYGSLGGGTAGVHGESEFIGVHGESDTGHAGWFEGKVSIHGDLTVGAYGKLGVGVGDPWYRLELPNESNTTGRGRANAWVTYSSARWKTNIDAISDPLEKLKRLRGVYFDWKESGTHDIGMIAEEVAEVIPEVVGYEKDSGTPESLDYGRLVALLVEAVKEQQARIDTLEKALERQKSLEEEIATMKTMMTKLGIKEMHNGTN